MRTLPADIAQKIMLTNQTRANNADPSLSMWISRPTVPLTNDNFLEKQEILSATSITDSAVAVCHPKPDSDNTRVFVAYVADGRAHVISSLSRTRMESHVWSDYGLNEPATSVSIAFDGTMPKDSSRQVEFITDTMPWVFWTTSDGHAYAQIVGDTESRLELASANVTDLSAVRSPWSEVLAFDYGLCVFHIMSGSVYVRQLIGGVWYDAEPLPTSSLPELPSGVSWQQVSASRTWDYRVALQLVDTSGNIYEVFTQYMGIGTRNVEHLNIKSVRAAGNLISVEYTDTKEAEHVDVANVSATGMMIYGLSSIPISAQNIANSDNDFGFLISVILDYPVTNVDGNAEAFSLLGEGIAQPIGQAISVSPDGLTLTIEFMNFNNAEGDITISYSAGTIQSPATALEDFSITFSPTGLVPLAIPAPVVQSIGNI